VAVDFVCGVGQRYRHGPLVRARSMYPTFRTTYDDGVISIRPRGILYTPRATIRVRVGDIWAAVVKFELGQGYLNIKAEGQGLITLHARRQGISELVQILKESGVSVDERKTFQRMRMP
jgi:hypothetical protein